ncbi:dynein axonemal intermediate chain 4-like isoform X2 [Ischnura elegans]|uniref:dynein axonemal intermediate chain 4-like isoform X2 n=1 Tax=Ischnura elegans TaxID=197161 RepID=UPI001ED8BCFA|nr:dynein axonemal intermediate chain 4-like isoform X2 [Ischnura elegans]
MSRLRVFYKDEDVTPEPLGDPFHLYMREAPRMVQVEDLKYKDSGSFTEDENLEKVNIPIVEDDMLKNSVKPGLEIPKNLAKPIGDDAFKVLLRETKTFIILCIDSKFRDKGEKHYRENEKSELQRKLVEKVSHSTQTMKSLKRDESTMTSPVIMVDVSTFVSNWDLYCSSLDKKPVSQMGKKSKFWSKFDKVVQPTQQEQMSKTVKLRQFKHACIITERLLASNNYSEKQTKFLRNPDAGSHDKTSKFHYDIEELWAFSCIDTANRAVTSISWNPIIEGALAVGYGTLDFHDFTGGLVCIWSLLNPCQPEQFYKFDHSVNDVKFSQDQPELLAAACHDGSIWIIHATLGTKMPIKSSCVSHIGPVWSLEWVTHDDFVTEEEVLISSGNDGRICYWNICNESACSQILHLRYGPQKQLKPSAEGTIKGNHYLSGLTLSIDPMDRNIYYVGTSHGFLAKCSMDCKSNFLDIVMAHQGPVYSVQFSPFCPNILLTCGGDWTMRLWIKGVEEPLLLIRTAMEAVMKAVWSPVHSTIIVSISGNELALWDLSQKIQYPMRVAYIAKGTVYTTVEFTNGGNNVTAGDDDGNVHVYNLQEMPFIPYHQEKFLISSLENYLKSSPKLLSKLEKMKSG